MSATKSEKEHLNRVVALGCLICGNQAEVHHILEGRASQRKVSHFETIPLCPRHHRTGGHGIAIHAGAETWRRIYGSEKEMLERTNRIIDEGLQL